MGHVLDHRTQIERQLKRFLDAPSQWGRPPPPTTSPSTLTDPSPGPTTDEFEAEYGFAADRVERLSGRAWLVVSGDRRWVLRLHDPELQVFHPGEIATLRFLESVDFHTPRLLPTRRGDFLIRQGNKVGYTVSYLEGESIDRSLNTIREIGRLIAQVHSQNAANEDIPDSQHSVDVRREQFRRNETDPETRAWEGFSAIHRDLSDAWEQLPDFKDLPRVVVHSDLLFHNAIRTPEGPLALIDWDGTGIGSAVQDIGSFFKSYAVSPAREGLRTEVATAFLSGYNEIRTLSPSEWDVIPDAMIYGSIFTVLWYERVYERAWFRTRLILDHRDIITQKLSAIRDSL